VVHSSGQIDSALDAFGAGLVFLWAVAVVEVVFTTDHTDSNGWERIYANDPSV